MDNKETFNEGLVKFINQSPTPFHVVDTTKKLLKDAHFIELKEKDEWHLTAGKCYYFTRNDSSIVTFNYQPTMFASHGIKMVGAHTDSPCLRIKPNALINAHGYVQLGVEVYGHALLSTWFDRDLSLAGRVNYLDTNGNLNNVLINFNDPIAVIPNLAIHLNRQANEKSIINKQTDLTPIITQIKQANDFDFNGILKSHILSKGTHNIETVLDYELSLYDTQSAAFVGLHSEFIASARLDNLLSCYIGVASLLASDKSQANLLIFNDHEEVGNNSTCGAQGTLLNDCLQRLIPDTETRIRAISQSLMISVDNTHGIHPNYPDKHDHNHSPLLNHGVAIKVNSAQRYASNSENGGIFRQLCMQQGFSPQVFITRGDLECGTTIGPITASKTGISTIDIGIPTFAMHSIRELAGTNDAIQLSNVLKHFFEQSILF